MDSLEYAMQIIENLKSLRRRRLRDFLLYVAVSALAIGLMFAMLSAGLSWDSFIKWFGLAFLTGSFFWYFISDTRALWERKSFWSLIICFFVLHCAIWTAVLTQVEHWKFIWFAPMLIEIAIFLYLREWIFG